MPRQLYLHIGAPKTGTTFLQSVMKSNKDALSDLGLCYPGFGSDHFLAALDLLDRKFKGHDDPRVPGSWQHLVDEVQQFPGSALISHEILSSARRSHAERAVASFPDHEVHVVYTARDLVRQLPAVWQERVKNRAELEFGEFFASVAGGEPSSDGDFSRAWRMQDVARVLSIWSGPVPAPRVHLVTVPPKGAPRDLLLDRFVGLMGVDSAALRISGARGNESLGAAETSVIRRLNCVLASREPALPWPYYSSEVKFFLGNEVLPKRAGATAIQLTEEQHDWAATESARIIERVSAADYDVVGSLDELRPGPYERAGQYVSPDRPDPELERDAAVDALAGLLFRIAEREQHDQHLAQRVGMQVASRGTFSRRVVRRVARIPWVARRVARR